MAALDARPKEKGKKKVTSEMPTQTRQVIEKVQLPRAFAKGVKTSTKDDMQTIADEHGSNRSLSREAKRMVY